MRCGVVGGVRGGVRGGSEVWGSRWELGHGPEYNRPYLERGGLEHFVKKEKKMAWV